MSAENESSHSAPSWFVPPGEGDSYAWISLFIIILAIYGLITLYAAFDRWAEHHSQGTPFAKTIPTMLAIALLYEIFPLDHFHAFLPVTAILIAVAADWNKYRLTHAQGLHPWQTEVARDDQTSVVAENTEKAKGDARDV